jgi:hypothetical protein
MLLYCIILKLLIDGVLFGATCKEGWAVDGVVIVWNN